MSMLYYIEVSNDITKLKQYDHIEKNQSSQIFISEMELIMDLTLQKLKLFLTIKPTNLRLIKYVVAKQLTSIIFMTIYLKEKDLQLFILHIKILLQMEPLAKKRTNPTILEVIL